MSRKLAAVFICFLGTALEGASLKSEPVTPALTATVADATYCFARVRGLRPDRLPPSFLVLDLHLQMTYRNPGTRALIMPLPHERKVYTSLAPGTMKVLREPFFLNAPSVSVMKHLPADVNPDDPANPPNDVFGVIPARGDLTMKDPEEVILTIYRKSSRYHDPDLRGHRVYLRLKVTQQELDPVLEAVLSDRWTSIGRPWTGTLLSNTLVFDVPATPQASPCVDKRDPNTVTNKPPENNR